MKINKKTTKEILNFYQDKTVVKVYDNERFSGHGGNYLDLVETSSIKKHINKGEVLELGPGTGRLTTILKNKAGINLTCLDSSLEMLKLLKKKVKVNNIINQSIFDKIRITKKFDYITALRFFDHFSIVDQNKILKNIIPKLKKQGIIIYSALNKNSSESLLSRFFYFSKTNYFYSFDEYEKMFSRNKLKIVSFSSHFMIPRGVYLRFKKNSIVFKILSSIDERLAIIFNKNGSLYTFVLESK